MSRRDLTREARATPVMPLQGVIFDLDGTVGDTLPVCFFAFREVFQTYLGRTYSDKEIRAMFGPTEEGMIEQAVPDRFDEAFAAYLSAYEKGHASCCEPFPGMRQVMQALEHRRVRRAIVTGKGPHSAAISLRVLGLANSFERVEAGSPRGNVKPEKMRRVIEAWGLDPATIACVGDAPSDIRAARENGAIPLAAAWASTADYEALRALGAHETFRRVEEFLEWIERNTNHHGV
jgi:phosphoglycolate phosphatase-like HAD superfamily hydrolase